MIRLFRYLLTIFTCFIIASCGGGGGEDVVIVPKSNLCVLSGFYLKIATNLTSYPGGWVGVSFNSSKVASAVVEKPEINIASIQAKFSISTGATITVNGVPQVSQVTANNYTNAVVFRVTAEDGVTYKNYTVNVTRLVP